MSSLKNMHSSSELAKICNDGYNMISTREDIHVYDVTLLWQWHPFPIYKKCVIVGLINRHYTTHVHYTKGEYSLTLCARARSATDKKRCILYRFSSFSPLDLHIQTTIHGKKLGVTPEKPLHACMHRKITIKGHHINCSHHTPTFLHCPTRSSKTALLLWRICERKVYQSDCRFWVI